MERFGQAKVDHLGHRSSVVQRDQHVRRLDVPVDDPLLMGMLDGMADGDEQLQSLAGIQPFFVAVGGDRLPLDQFHHEVGSPLSVVPASRTLAMLGWSIIDSAWRSASKRASTWRAIHAGFDQLERHPPSHRFVLFGHPHRPHRPPSPICCSSLYGPICG
jgi:hypothetical protein